MLEILKTLKSLLDKIIKTPTPEAENTATFKNVSGSSIRVEQFTVKHLTLIQQVQPPPENSSIERPRDFRDKIVPSFLPYSNTDSSALSDRINKRIDQAVTLIHTHQIQAAKNLLFELLGELKTFNPFPKKEIVRIYNNLGVCFNGPRDEGGDYNEAVKYFLLVLEHDPLFVKAKINLAVAHLNKGDKENIKKSYEIASNLWTEKFEGDPQPLMSALLFSTYYHKSLEQALNLIENDEKFKVEAEKSEELLSHISSLYLESGNYEKALDFSKSALKLKIDSFQATAVKGLSLMSLVQKVAKQAYYQVSPQIQDFQEVEAALSVLKHAKDLFPDGCNNRLLEEVKLAIATCYLWLNKVSDEGYAEIRKNLNVELLSSEHEKLINVIDFASFLKIKDYDSALRTFINHKDFKTFSGREKERIAVMFLLEGATEQAEELFRMTEADGMAASDYQFWLSRSAVAILQQDKNMAIHYTEKAKTLVKESTDKKRVLSHHNAVMLRYAERGEVERLMSGMLEYDKNFPEDKALIKVQALEEDGKISQEMKDILLRQKQWFENIRNIFLCQPVITYILEAVLKRPYVDVISVGISNRDLKFVAPFHSTDKNFYEFCTSSLENNEVIVFDYASLLNISKMGLLRHLERLGKRCVISKKLFRKLQNELLMVEREELRNLWNFLRKSKTIEFQEYPEREILKSDLKGLFDDWLIETVLLAKQEKSMLVSDDLRLLEFTKHRGVAGSNTLALVKRWKEQELIDDKIYSESLGDYAERFYRFISYTGDDLFRIAMEDKGKITWRSFFLVNEIFSPGANIKSFTLVFIRFIHLIWGTSMLAEDKFNWLACLTADIFDKVICRKIAFKDDVREVEPILEDLIKIWTIPIKVGSKDELEEIESRMNKLALSRILSEGMIIVKSHVQRRNSELASKVTV